MEQNHRLFALKDNHGDPSWDVVRFDVFEGLEQFLGIEPPPAAGNSVGKEGPVAWAGKAFRKVADAGKAWVKYRQAGPVDFLVFKASRNRDGLGQPIDFASMDGARSLASMGQVLEVESVGNSSEALNIHELMRGSKLVLGMPCLDPESTEALVSTIARAIQGSFGLALPQLAAIVQARIRLHLLHRRVWGDLLDRTTPRLIFMTQNGIQKGLIMEARKRSIPIIECQHGYINKMHPAYSYPADLAPGPEVILPDALGLFSDYWTKQCTVPGTELVVTGNSCFCAKNGKSSTLKGPVVFPVASAITEFLVPLAIEVATLLPDRSFIIKLHPSELGDRDRIQAACAGLANVSVLGAEVNFSNLLTDASGVVMIQSTTAYEALERGVPVHIFRRSYFMGSSDLFACSNVHLFDSATELVTALTRPPALTPCQETAFFDDFDQKAFSSMIDGLLGRKEGSGPRRSLR